MIVENNKEFKSKIKEINKRFSDMISNFMGIDFKFTVSSKNQDKSYSLSAHAKFVTYTKPLNQKIVDDIIPKAIRFIQEYINENDNITARLYNNLIDEVAMSLLFEDYTETDEEVKLKRIKFIDDLKTISFKSYECNIAEMGIVFFSSDINLKSFSSKYPFEYIPLKGDKTISELIECEKPMLKIVDNKSIGLVIDCNFFVTGIIRKRQGQKSIQQVFEEEFQKNDILYTKLSIYQNLKHVVKNITDNESINKIINKSQINDINVSDIEKVLNYLNADSDKFIHLIEEKINSLEYEIKENVQPIKYISLKNMEMICYGNHNFLLTYNKNKWKIKQYSLLLAYIFEYIIPPDTFGFLHTPLYDKEHLFEDFDLLLNKICKLIKSIKNLSSKNNGALFIILNNDELNKNDSDYLDKATPISLFQSDPTQNKEYKSVIRKNDGLLANILDIDSYLLECIASVDGATIFDEELNLISFSEIVKQKSRKTKSQQKMYGARTNAAIAASKYGLVIKVSEDGDVEVYNNGKMKFRI